MLDDAEERGGIVSNANAAELFPDMTELHLMQANRKAPSTDPQRHQAPAQGGQPAGPQGLTQEPVGVTQAGRGAGAGRFGARGGRGGRQGGRGRLPGAPARGHVNIGATGPAQVQQHQSLPGLQGNFAANGLQKRLTPAQQAIQQGKLQQQQHFRQQDQPVSAQYPQQQQGQLTQQQQQEEEGVAGQAAAQQPGSNMQGVQHSHWDTSYSAGAPTRDPRQMPISQSTGGLQAGASPNLNRPLAPRPVDPHPSSALVHHNSTSQPVADPRLRSGHHALQQASAAPGEDTFAGRRSQVSDSEVLLQYPGAAPKREYAARPAMPAIPGVPGQQAPYDHNAYAVDHLQVGNQQLGDVDASRQGQDPRRPQHSSLAVGSSGQQLDWSASPHGAHVVQAGDPGGVVAAEVVQDMCLGRNDIAFRHTESTSAVPAWTNNRR